MRPLWYEFPKDEVTFGREGSHMLGEALLVTPVLQKSTTQGRILLRHSCAHTCWGRPS
jgi:alpha-glucosidase (family GH31 glycosyl hydrolase)